MATFKDYLAYFENNQEWLDKCVDMILQHGFMLDNYNERYFKQDFIYDLEQSYGLGNLSACGKLFKVMLPKIKKLAMDKLIGGEEKAIEYCMTAIERKQKQTEGFGYDFFNCFGIPWAAKMYFEKRMGTPEDMATPPGSIGYLIGNVASALDDAYRFRVKSQDYVRRIAELFVESEEGTRYLEELASKCTKEINESKTVKLNESDLRMMVTECVKRVIKEMDELSPKLLQKAADKAWDMNRWSQHEAFEDEAGARAQAEFGENNGIRIVTPKKISYEAPDGGFCVIFRDGTYSYRPRNGYNNETGNLRGGNEFPKYMRVPDKRVARSLVRWWKTYNECEAPVPFMEDWHNLLQW